MERITGSTLAPVCPMPNTSPMSIHPNLQLLLHIIDQYPGSTVVELTEHLKPYAPAHDPHTQQAVRTRLRALLAAGFVQLGHKGKPRTYLRTQQSYRVVPSHGPFDPETLRRRPPKQAQR